jgi:hypothetical protein
MSGIFSLSLDWEALVDITVARTFLCGTKKVPKKAAADAKYRDLAKAG